MKKSLAFVVLGLLCAVPVTFLTPSAFAQQAGRDMQPVEISGHKLLDVRYDVSKVCPEVSASLQNSLSMITYRENVSTQVRVNFRLTGDKVDEVKSQLGTLAYRQAARRAVRRLECADASNTQPQEFSFIISFVSPDDESLAQNQQHSLVAVLEK